MNLRFTAVPVVDTKCHKIVIGFIEIGDLGLRAVTNRQTGWSVIAKEKQVNYFASIA